MMKKPLMASTACALCLLTANGGALAQESGQALFGLTSASVTYGPYLRAELGVAQQSLDDAFWQPPGYPRDPEIDFSLDDERTGFNSIAMGFDWQNGWRLQQRLGRIGLRRSRDGSRRHLRG